MDNEMSDKNIDRIMTSVMRDAELLDGEIDQIVDSPKLWWSIQKNINSQQETTRAPWPPVDAIRRWLLIGVPSAAAIAALLIAFAFSGGELPVATDESLEIAGNSGRTMATHPGDPTKTAKVSDSEPNALPVSPANSARISDRASTARKKHADRPSRSLRIVRQDKTETTNDEVKSEFIALSYARDPESGQLVRVRVPSSMMVTLGLVSTVKQPNELIDAEIVVGDDGLTRAIRFIR